MELSLKQELDVPSGKKFQYTAFYQTFGATVSEKLGHKNLLFVH